MTIYKYLNPQAGSHFLENWSVAFSAPVHFNDPFDGNPAIAIPSQAEKDRRIDSIKERRKDWEERSRQKYAEIFEEWHRRIETQTMWERVTRDGFRISCFTRTRNHPLMWSHYARAHTGLLIGFRESCKFFEGRLQPVIYSDTRPQYCLFKEGFKISDVVNKAACLSKGIEWAYEQESRMILDRNEMSQLENVVDKRSNSTLVRLEKSDIEMIVFGLRFNSDVMKAAIGNFLVDSSTYHIEMFRARPDAQEYKLNYTPIEWLKK
jgi:hypothetical protein